MPHFYHCFDDSFGSYNIPGLTKKTIRRQNLEEPLAIAEHYLQSPVDESGYAHQQKQIRRLDVIKSIFLRAVLR